MVPAMDEVGRLFEAEEYFVPELLLAGRAMKSAMELIRPLMIASGQKMAVRVIIGTVKGDLHDIGKNIVASMLEGSGFEVIDLGADVSPEKFVAAVKERQPQIVCMSALLTVTMPAMKTTIDALEYRGRAHSGEGAHWRRAGHQPVCQRDWRRRLQRERQRRRGPGEEPARNSVKQWSSR